MAGFIESLQDVVGIEMVPYVPDVVTIRAVPAVDVAPGSVPIVD